MDSNDSMLRTDGLCTTNFKEKFETLRSLDQQSSLNAEKNGQDLSPLSKLDSNPSMMITSELLRLIPGENDTNDEGRVKINKIQNNHLIIMLNV